ncbi:MAG TPA: phosphatase PAP2 family protein [Longimicrobiaceae bacterium]|nr:phosphatase PAP2 family protein [Longimicrobiaceae bacterium]
MTRPDPFAGPERRAGSRRGVLEHPLMDAVYATLRWIRGHVRGFYAAVGLFLVAGLALSAAAIGLFALLATRMAGGATQRFDEAVVRGLQGWKAPWLDALALMGAALGSGAAAWVVIGAGTLYFWRSRHPYSLALLWISLLGGRVLNRLLKEAFGRPRPALVEGDLVLLGYEVGFPTSGSFPSGHALTSVVIYGTLAYLVARLEPTPRMRRWTLAGAAVLVLGIGFSRLYLAVHYPSDVLAGYLAGFVWATTCALGVEAVRYFSDRKPEAREAEADLERGIRPLREAVEGEPG